MSPPHTPATRIADEGQHAGPTDGSRRLRAASDRRTRAEGGSASDHRVPIVGRSAATIRHRAHACGPAHLQRGREHRRGARRGSGPRCPSADVLVVDDGSPDGTAELAEKRRPPSSAAIAVLRRAGKSGLGSAYRAGFASGIDEGYDVLVEMDSDLSHDPAALPGAARRASSDGADLADRLAATCPAVPIPDWTLHRAPALASGATATPRPCSVSQVRDATAGLPGLPRPTRCAARPRPHHAPTATASRSRWPTPSRASAGASSRCPITFTDRVRGTSKMSGSIVVEALVLVTWWGLRGPRAASAAGTSARASAVHRRPNRSFDPSPRLGVRDDIETGERADPALLVPPVRLGRLLSQAREAPGRTPSDLARGCGLAYDESWFAQLEAGRSRSTSRWSSGCPPSTASTPVSWRRAARA